MTNAIQTEDPNSLEHLLSDVRTKKRFSEILGRKAPGFISSILQVKNSNQALADCEPMSVIASAVIAATLDLPINPNLGFAAIVPYSKVAQFQMMWKGFVQLGHRTGEYERMNAADVYEDELDVWNPITGEFTLTPQSTWTFRAEGKTEKIVGYVAYFKLINGFEKYWFMTVDQIKTHGQKYSKSYGHEKGQWRNNFPAMALKTVLKLLLAKFGPLSTEMQRAIKADQAVVALGPGGEEFTYPDGAGPVYDTTAVTGEPLQEPQRASETPAPAPETKPAPAETKPPPAEPPAKPAAAPAPQGKPKAPQSFRAMASKIEGSCETCHKKMPKGTAIYYDTKAGRAHHREHYA